jgi:hypothetical protein
VQTGEFVIYHDPKGQPHNALVTTVHSNWKNPCINVVIVSSDETRRDGYGRQIERVTSVSHASHVSAHGNYWRRPDEQPNAYQAPVAA